MTKPDVTFEEAAARRGVESVPLAHLSIELGHLYIEEFAGGWFSKTNYLGGITPEKAPASSDRLQPNSCSSGSINRPIVVVAIAVGGPSLRNRFPRVRSRP